MFVRLLSLVGAVGLVPVGAGLTPFSASKAAALQVVTYVATSRVLTDHSANALGYAGAQAAARHGHLRLHLAYAPAFTRYLPDLRSAARHAALVVAGDPQLAIPLRLVAADYPRVRFVTIGATSYAPNVRGNLFRSTEALFLAGMLAAGVSRSHVVAFIGAFADPSLRPQIAAFRAGARAYDRRVRLVVAYTASYTNQARGVAVGTQALRQGADVLYSVAGAAALGVLKAAAQHHAYSIGTGVDQNSVYPRSVVSSVVERVDLATSAAIQAAATGHFQGGTTVWTLANGGVGLAPYHSLGRYVPARVRRALAQARLGLIAHRITLPGT